MLEPEGRIQAVEFVQVCALVHRCSDAESPAMIGTLRREERTISLSFRTWLTVIE